MNMVPCADCKAPISPSATTCPNCGAALAKAGKWKASDWISLATLILAVTGAVVAYREFVVADNWKRREFVSAQIKEFYADKINGNVLTMLDYNPATVELYPDKANPSDRTREVRFVDFVAVIADEHDLVGDKLLLRQQFEHFLQALARFDYLAKYDAVRPAELCADLGYPVSLLAGDPDTRTRKLKNSGIDIDPLAKAMRSYINAWAARNIERFIMTMGRACVFKTPYLPAKE